MFTDQELNILEFDIFPIVTKFNDLQKVFDNLDEKYIDLFSKWCQSEDIDTSEVVIGTYGKEENDVLYLCGFPKKGYEKYKGIKRHGSKKIKEAKTETRIILPENCKEMFNGCEILESIEGSDKGDTSKVKYMDWMFYGCENLEELDVSNGDVSNVKIMGRMFVNCIKLEFLNVSNGDVSKVEDMRSMFDGCENLEKLDVSNGNVSKVKDMYSMFASCKKLENLDVSNGNVSKVEDMGWMFYGCESLENLDVSNGDVSNVRNTYSMFANCESLIELKGILNGNISSLKHPKFTFNGTPDFKDKDKILRKFGVK